MSLVELHVRYHCPIRPVSHDTNSGKATQFDRKNISGHWVKYSNFTQFLGVESLWKCADSTELSQNFHITKLGETPVFYTM